MKKVVYSISKKSRKETDKVTGYGYITDKDLIIACMSKTGKPYVRVFQECISKCTPIMDKPNEYKGSIYEIYEIEQRDVEVEYYIWYKTVEWEYVKEI